MHKQPKYISPSKNQNMKPGTSPQVPSINTSSRDATRRIWVKRPDGVATSLYVKQDTLVDDLKTMIIGKYPMSLAKWVDPSDIVIKLEPALVSSAYNPMPVSATQRKPPGPSISAPYMSTSPSSFNSPLSPIPISASKSSLIPPRVPSSEYNARSVSPAASLTAMPPLEPDRSVWSIVDTYYPTGMGIENAFIVETPVIQPPEAGQSAQTTPTTSQFQQGQQPTMGSVPYPGNSHRKSLSNETIQEGKEEDFSNTQFQRRMKSVSSGQPLRSTTPSSLHRRSMSNPAEHASAVLLMPSNAKTNRSNSSAGLMTGGAQNRGLSVSPDTSSSPTDGIHERFNIHKTAPSGAVQRTASPSSKIGNGTSTMAKVLPSVNVLIVEDNLINLRILSAHLRRHRIHYDVAKNGQEAIDKWRNGGFHLVLMDIQLPVMSGIDATKEIRRLEKMNHIGVFSTSDILNLPPKKPEDNLDLNVFRSPVIIVALTASNLKQDKQEALAAGCNDYLTKPVNLDWLLNKITEWGCMQALIDFDGWKSGERMTNISAALPTLTRNASARKVLTSKAIPQF